MTGWGKALRRLLPSLETIYGKDKTYPDPYLTRWRWGRLAVHVFHRGDNDPDMHDHPADFWTFPLVGYYEELPRVVPAGKSEWWCGVRYTEGQRYIRHRLVDPFRWHFRPAETQHRVLFPQRADAGFFITNTMYGIQPWAQAKQALWPIVTVVWWGRSRRPWGFWTRESGEFIPWRQYIFGDGGTK